MYMYFVRENCSSLHDNCGMEMYKGTRCEHKKHTHFHFKHIMIVMLMIISRYSTESYYRL